MSQISNNRVLKIHYINPEVEELYKTAGVQEKLSSGFDLMNIEEIVMDDFNPFQLINLGVVIQPPAGFHSILMPRSSTFKKYEIMQANSLGLIDAEDAIYRIPVLFLGRGNKTIIPKGEIIASFHIKPLVHKISQVSRKEAGFICQY